LLIVSDFLGALLAAFFFVGVFSIYIYPLDVVEDLLVEERLVIGFEDKALKPFLPRLK
jgi:hypothetical protein